MKFDKALEQPVHGNTQGETWLVLRCTKMGLRMGL